MATENRYIGMQELRALQIEMLNDIDAYCKANGLRYFLTGGTLLGAVRHKGYIPWDDDIDIVMPRKDYEFFLNNYQCSDGRNRVVSVYNEQRWVFPFAKMIDNRTVLVENADIDTPEGVYVDVFPSDNMGNNAFKARVFFERVRIIRQMLLLKNTAISKKRAWYKNAVLILIKTALSFVSAHRIALRLNNMAKSFNVDCTSKYICPVATAIYGRNEIMERTLYDQTVEVEFEGHYYCAPVGFDRVLTNLYGDYMKLPPKDKQVSQHNFEAWWKD